LLDKILFCFFGANKQYWDSLALPFRKSLIEVERKVGFYKIRCVYF
jgi:hypothetical protein